MVAPCLPLHGLPSTVDGLFTDTHTPEGLELRRSLFDCLHFKQPFHHHIHRQETRRVDMAIIHQSILRDYRLIFETPQKRVLKSRSWPFLLVES
jgi:hypothetical protein